MWRFDQWTTELLRVEAKAKDLIRKILPEWTDTSQISGTPKTRSL